MEVKGEAGLSAAEGEAVYSVKEADRAVTWTIRTRELEDMADWDRRSPVERLGILHAWRSGDESHQPILPTGYIRSTEPGDVPWLDLKWRLTADISRLEQHAIVARNALRNFLGRSES